MLLINNIYNFRNLYRSNQVRSTPEHFEIVLQLSKFALPEMFDISPFGSSMDIRLVFHFHPHILQQSSCSYLIHLGVPIFITSPLLNHFAGPGFMSDFPSRQWTLSQDTRDSFSRCGLFFAYAVTMKSTFWDVMQDFLLPAYCWLLTTPISRPWRWRQYLPLKSR
jgi:hypothetical protein